MNYRFLCSVFRKTKQYRDLTDALSAPAYGRRYPFSVSGITESAEPVFLLSLSRDVPKKGTPLLLVFDDMKKALSYSDFLSSNGVASLFYPAREYCFMNVISSHDLEGMRLSVLASLSGLSDTKPEVVCTTADAVLQLVPDGESIKAATLRAGPDSRIDIGEFVSSLTASGYVRVELVEAPGQFTVRGGIIDVYPPSDSPVRIELFGDEVDRIGTFSVDTQRFDEMLDRTVTIPPVREVILTGEKKKEIVSVIKRHIQRIGRSSGETRKLALVSLEGEIGALENGLETNFIDKYLPTVYPEAKCLLDYPFGCAVIMDSAAVDERTRANAGLLAQSLETLAEDGELPPQGESRYTRDLSEIYDRQEGPVVICDRLPRVRNTKTGGVFAWDTRHVPSYAMNTRQFTDDLSRFMLNGYLCAVLCSGESEKQSLLTHLTDDGYTAASAEESDSIADILKNPRRPVLVMTGSYSGGFELTSPKFILMNYSNDSQKLQKGSVIKSRKKPRLKATEAIMSYADLNIGDIVVHDAYGIGRFEGLENLTTDSGTRDYIRIIYAGGDKLFMPVNQLDHVSKYIGADTDTIKLSKMGGTDWTRAKSRAKASTREMAKELVELYAARRRTEGIAFDPDDAMCREFADSFEYEETPGQLAAIDDVRRDMERPYPMDRLLCGDVGYGKTEVALRAAFKAVMSGKQVAMLVPTTILAYQHYQTFMSRMRAFPVRVDMLSRFNTPKEQAAAVRRIARGDTDIAIGTHRIISNDVVFKDLGLIIIDEEQRFGVAQKERLKKAAINADVLTLTATPIPRTLNMSMGGIVDMSLLEEAPGLRSPVQTYVMEHDDAIIFEAVRRELRRGGQVFYLFNDIDKIDRVAEKLHEAVPEARIAVGHGRMSKDEIEKIWDMTIRGEVDILVCTTIIETGVDIPNANTLIIENADRYGLSQLHQIRGRVGRSSVRAFAYLTYRKGKELSEIAQKRLSAIREYAEFGAGFRIALRDLEIRGAGNLLGAEQHGHMDSVGYDLFMRLLEESVTEVKTGKVRKKAPDCAVDVRCDAYLTKSYIVSQAQRMDMYKRIARIETEADYDDLIDELCDRYGEPDSQAVNLCRIARIRALGRKASLTKVEERNGVVKLYSENMNLTAAQKLSEKYPSLGMRMVLGQYPFLQMKKKQGERNTEFLIDILLKFNEMIEKYPAQPPETPAEEGAEA